MGGSRQLLCHVEAIDRLLRTRGRLPVNVVCLFEGEEEIGSPHLAEVLDRRRALSLRRTSPSRPTPGCSAPDADLLRGAGTARPWGICGQTLYERTAGWPALTVNGLAGGYQGPGGKSVIPSTATAKLGVRRSVTVLGQRRERSFGYRRSVLRLADHGQLVGLPAAARSAPARQ